MRSYKAAVLLSLFTIFYNLLEGAVSLYFGYADETLALFGFGADSFIEIVSGLGVLQMVIRIWNHPGSLVGRFEVRALRITGYGFYLLTAGLVAGIVLNLIHGHKPESTSWGTVIALLSILVMTWLVWAKRRTGKRLNSDAILADANCTLVCVYMSLVLLVASLVYTLTGFAYADAIGAAGLAWFSFREGREALEKAARKSYACVCHGETGRGKG